MRRGSDYGIRPRAGAVVLMRAPLLLLALAGAAGTGAGAGVGVGAARLAAQAVERSDVPGGGVLRVSFDPRVLAWDAQFTAAGRLVLGFPLTGDTLGGAHIPVVARLERDLRTASGLPGFVASLGAARFSARQERRVYPFTVELGVTRRLALKATVPVVRVATRTSLALSSRGANLGLNPRLQGVPGADSSYADFFRQFDASLAQLNANIAGGMYGCPSSPQCQAARDSLAAWTSARDALREAVYGAGQVGSPFLPLDSSDAGRALAARIAAIQQQLAATYGIAAFTAAFLLATDTLTPLLLQAALVDSATGFGYRGLPFRNSFRYALGDVELAAKYRFAGGRAYAGAVEALVRLPTGAQDSAEDFLRQSIGDHQTDLEAALVQELTVGPLWLNVAVRGGTQRPGTRVRRVAPVDAVWVPFAATAALRWDPGDYAGVDVAPLVRLAPQFAAGFTAGYWSKGRDRYRFLSAQDSVALAARLGAPTSASVLDAGTAERRLRLGVAVTYVGPVLEGGFSIEQTVSGAGGAPAATVYRLVLRTAGRLF